MYFDFIFVYYVKIWSYVLVFMDRFLFSEQTYTVEPFLQRCPSSGWWRCCLAGLMQRWWNPPYTLMKNKYMKGSENSNSSESWGVGHNRTVCSLTGRSKRDDIKISINCLWCHGHTCCLNRVAALVVEWRREGRVGTGWTTVLNSRKQLREPHPQSVVTTNTQTDTHNKSDLRLQQATL